MNQREKDIQEIKHLKALVNKLNADFRAYCDDAIHQAGWEEKEIGTASTKASFVHSIGELVAAMLPEPNNAMPLGELRIYAPVCLDDIGALIRTSDLPCDHSNSD